MSNDDIDLNAVKKSSDLVRNDLNADPITGQPGAHPIGTGIGATGGAATGAALGVIAGPVGIVVGSAIGAVVGGLAGKSVAESINPTEQARYWREKAIQTHYYDEARLQYEDITYERDFNTAYQVGYENRPNYDADTRFEDVEHELKNKWEQTKGQSRLNWEQAKHAVRDAWNRVHIK